MKNSQRIVLKQEVVYMLLALQADQAGVMEVSDADRTHRNVCK